MKKALALSYYGRRKLKPNSYTIFREVLKLLAVKFLAPRAPTKRGSFSQARSA